MTGVEGLEVNEVHAALVQEDQVKLSRAGGHALNFLEDRLAGQVHYFVNQQRTTNSPVDC